mgnify:CR=1 FL=1
MVSVKAMWPFVLLVPNEMIRQDITGIPSPSLQYVLFWYLAQLELDHNLLTQTRF